MTLHSGETQPHPTPKSLKLITTALWHRSDLSSETVFLGDWCLPFPKEEGLEEVKYEVVPYFWNDRDRFRRHNTLIADLYEKLLKQLGNALADIHEVQASGRYWRIILGPWLFYFVSIFWERYHAVESALQKYKAFPLSAEVDKSKRFAYIPASLPEFLSCVESEEWNKSIYDDVLRYLAPDLCRERDRAGNPDQQNVARQFLQTPSASWGRNLLHAVLAFFARRFPSHVILNSGLAAQDLVVLGFYLRQLPLIRVIQKHSKISGPNYSLREAVISKLQSNSTFERFLIGQIVNQLPLSYLEDFEWIRSQARKTYPLKPKSILTGYGFLDDDIFKVWTAESVESGCRFNIFQHGGQTGVRLFDQTEEHQMEICDKFFSWGWKGNSQKVIPVSSAKLSEAKRSVQPNYAGQVLLICQPTYRYPRRLSAEPVGPQEKKYLESQILFVNSLDGSVRKHLSFRLYQGRDPWGFKKKIQDAGYESLVADRSLSFWEQMTQSRIVVLTYNATTLLEALALNFPTLMFWNPDWWELNKEARPWFEKFASAGVFHASPELAAAKLNEVYDDVERWWGCRQIQSIRERFCQQFCLTSSDWKREWARNIIQDSGSLD